MNHKLRGGNSSSCSTANTIGNSSSCTCMALNREKGLYRNNDMTFLLLDEKLQILPWEQLPFLKSVSGYSNCSRLPHLAFLLGRSVPTSTSALAQSSSTQLVTFKSRIRGVYCLDPHSNLPRSRVSLGNLLTLLSLALGWSGYVGVVPLCTPSLSNSCNGDAPESSRSQVFPGLKDHSDLFLYFGHGGGSLLRYFTNRNVGSVILFGCSSARMATQGR